MVQTSSSEWSDGHYLFMVGSKPFAGLIKTGEKVALYGTSFDSIKDTVTWEVCDFGEAQEHVAKATDTARYNIALTSLEFVKLGESETVGGVLSEDGKKVTVWLHSMVVDIVRISEEEAEKLRDAADPADAPSSHYQLQPGNVGSLLWVAGAPGHGKSTVGKTMMENHGRVFYEGDGFMLHLNPFIPPGEIKPSDALFQQKPLKEISEDRKSVNSETLKAFKAMSNGTFDEDDLEVMDKFYSLMCEDIEKQRRRMGGDWVVTQAVVTRAQRDLIRQKLGPSLVFVVLEMDEELGMERLKNRDVEQGEAFNEMLAKMKQHYEAVNPEEKNAFAITVTEHMTPSDVVEKILNHELFKNNIYYLLKTAKNHNFQIHENF